MKSDDVNAARASGLADAIIKAIRNKENTDNSTEVIDEDGAYGDIYLKAIELESSEASNKDLIDWRRVRSLIEHENLLVNHRITWMLIAQASLFAVFGVLFEQLNSLEPIKADGTRAIFLWPLDAIVLLGAFICVLTYLNLKNAYEQIRRVTNWWYGESKSDPFWEKKYKKLSKKEKVAFNRRKKAFVAAKNEIHPPLHYSRSIEVLFEKKRIRRIARLSLVFFRIESLPWYFFTTWVLLFAIINFGNELGFGFNWLNQNAIPYAPYFTSGVLLGGIIIPLIFRIISRD